MNHIKTWQKRCAENSIMPHIGTNAIHACVQDIEEAMQAEINDLRAHIEVLESGELPEPVAKCVWGGKIEHLHEGTPSKLVGAALYTADQLRQAIATDRVKRDKEVQPVQVNAELLAALKEAAAFIHAVNTGSEPVIRHPLADELEGFAVLLEANPVPLPKEDTEEANNAITSMLAEYNYPANPQNAGRAGWRAARLYGTKAQPQGKRDKEVREGWKLVPVEPTPGMLDCIANKRFEEDWVAGKILQAKQRGENRVPYKTEYEIAVGQYQRMLVAAPQPQDGGE